MGPRSHEPPLRPDELRLLRVMMTEYRRQQAVDHWLGAKGRALVLVAGGLSAGAVLAAAVLQIVQAVH